MAGQLTEEQIAKFKAEFDELDADGKGTISREEFLNKMQEKGCKDLEQIGAIFDQVDADGKGEIDFDEFLAVTAEDKGQTECALRQAFQAFDQDGSGCVSAEELKQVLKTICKDSDTSDEAVDAMIAEVDTSNDGKVNFEEFLQMMGAK